MRQGLPRLQRAVFVPRAIAPTRSRSSPAAGERFAAVIGSHLTARRFVFRMERRAGVRSGDEKGGVATPTGIEEHEAESVDENSAEGCEGVEGVTTATDDNKGATARSVDRS